MGKLDNSLFYTCISILFLCIFLTFLFFTPKKISDDEKIVFVGNLSNEETMERALGLMNEGDIILTKPKSLYGRYKYSKEINNNATTKLGSFFFYNLFDKIIISSMGDTYWHVGIYIGNGTMNSLYLDNKNEKINKNFIEHNYFKVLKVKASEYEKKLAMKRAKEHYEKQDIYYSLKNGLLITYAESVKSKKFLDLKENELICSSYVAYLYREINFDNKPFTNVAPVDLEFSSVTELNFIVNKTGFYIKNETE